MKDTKQLKITIIGAGNLGVALARGLAKSKKYDAAKITLTRRRASHLEALKKEGFNVSTENAKAVVGADIIVVAVLPQQFNSALTEIKPVIKAGKQLIISLVTGVSSKDILHLLGGKNRVVRAMPNTAIAIGESMTCLSTLNAPEQDVALAKSMFDTVGETVIIGEEYMTAATALVACGIAFFLRAVRAASQGGTEIGFHAEEALKMAAQTAKGAASLILSRSHHPEMEIDKVTSPKGCTIAGLNEMEHQGFSSAMIKGIITSANKAGVLYSKD
ncbi:MAG: pyrroline-5-carboxylate reductase [Flavobacteriales bacterium]|nr:pyrroline-5-carboxylate reductase [Flavobacteriales bacterium]MCB9446881.1 pyrroline-5-carboxylate reductase [Flavobacteriales bacterium]